MKLMAAIVKEALILYRDRAGLAVLIIMPIALVLIVTLVQEDAFSANKTSSVDILFVDNDGSRHTLDLEKGLTDTKHFKIVKKIDGQPLTEESARAAVAEGDYQVCLVIPKDVFDTADRKADQLAEQAMTEQPPEETDTATSADENQDKQLEIVVYFDPATRDIYRKFIVNSLQRMVQAIEMKIMVAAIETLAAPDPAESPESRIAWEPGDLVGFSEVVAAKSSGMVLPTSVQQNVPAWTLFAMFMIAIPLSGSVIKERNFGTLLRLRSLPVSYWIFLTAKLTVYVSACLLQFVLMLLLGLFVLPWLGTPTLEMGPNGFAILVAAVTSALAAAGFGILIGTIAKTHDQASLFSATIVVIAAALGGIMVPVFLMPQTMRSISRFSPLNWGLNAFLDIFVRGGDLMSIAPYVLMLLAFFAVTMFLAVLFLMRRE